jgi:uncharacterized membrane protein YgdD (TMEM256/DUF423 family)
MKADAPMFRALVVFAGLFGIVGISLAAAASHLDDPRLFGSASLMCLVHAPALLALALGAGRLRTAYPAGVLMIVGVLLFSGDLIKRHYTGTALFPMSAPSGGIAMMAGWLVAAIGGLLPAR